MILTSLKWLLHVSVFKVLANQAGLILLFIFQGTLYIWAKLIINNKYINGGGEEIFLLL